MAETTGSGGRWKPTLGEVVAAIALFGALVMVGMVALKPPEFLTGVFEGRTRAERFAVTFPDLCKRNPGECACITDMLDKTLSDDEFSAMLDEAAETDKNGGDKKLGPTIMAGALVNEKVSKTFLQAAKVCQGR